MSGMAQSANIPVAAQDRSGNDLLQELALARARVRELESLLVKRGELAAIDDAETAATLLGHLPDYIYFKDHERRFVRVSESFRVLFGRPATEFLGLRDEDLFPPEVWTESVADDQRVLATGQPIINKLEGGVLASGDERWVLTTKLPWRDADGRIRGLFGISRDVSIQKRLEEAARASETRLQIVSDTVPFPVAITRIDDGTLLYANRALAEFVGIPLEQLVGSHMPDHYADPAERQALIEEVRRRGRVDGFSIRLRRQDGVIVTSSSSVIPLVMDGVPALMGAGVDVTELKERERQLESLGREKDMLLQEVNHRVRNNLATLLALVSRQMATSDSGGRAALTKLSLSIRGLSAVHDLFSISDWRPIVLGELCRQVILGATSGFERALRVSVAESKVLVAAQQAHQLALVLSELVTNSVKHGPADRPLSIDASFSEGSGEVRVRYSDNGPGFPPEVLARRSIGSGLKLLIGLVEYGLRGSVTLGNDPGAVVTLILPKLAPVHPMTSETFGLEDGQRGVASHGVP